MTAPKPPLPTYAARVEGAGTGTGANLGAVATTELARSEQAGLLA